MRVRKLTRWQKAAALVPMAVLVGAWGAALGNSGLATASDDVDTAQKIPDVPATAFDEPASVQQTPSGIPSGIDSKAGVTGTVKTLATNGIPTAALFAYRRAETLLGKADEPCHLPWNLVAAIGRVESNHGRTNGNALDADGVASPGIYGVPLDGKDGRARITDTDGGELDKNTVLDLAVGPMQFIPGTWASVAVDSDNDDVKNPQDIDDAATATGIYLCAGEGDLSDRSDAATAVKRYNNSDAYVDLVLKISAAYANGDFSPSPNGITSPSVLTSSEYDQTLTPAQRRAAASAQKKAQKKAAQRRKKPATQQPSGDTPTRSTPTSPAPSPAPGSGGDKGGSDGSGGGKGGGGGGTVGDGVQDLVDETPLAPLAPVTEPVTGLLTGVEANVQCLLKYPLGLPKTAFDACVYDLTH